MGKETEKWVGDSVLGKRRQSCLVLDYSSLESLGKRTKTDWGARRIGGRVDCGRQREVEGSGGIMGRRPRGEWGWTHRGRGG